jgi:hypothetical protein
MVNTKPWKEIREKYVSPERQRRNAAAAARTIMGLQRLRRARYLMQIQRVYSGLLASFSLN